MSYQQPLPGQGPVPHGHRARSKRITTIWLSVGLGILLLVAAVIALVFYPAAQTAAVPAPVSTVDAEAAAQAQKDADSEEFWAQVNEDNQAKKAESEKDTAEFYQHQADQRTADKEGTSESVIEGMEELGWTYYGDSLYFQYAPSDSFTCDYLACTYIHVTTLASNGCPEGIYVAASVERGEMSVGSTNSITAALPTGKDALVKLVDTSDIGDGFQLTTMRCLG